MLQGWGGGGGWQVIASHRFSQTLKADRRLTEPRNRQRAATAAGRLSVVWVGLTRLQVKGRTTIGRIQTSYK